MPSYSTGTLTLRGGLDMVYGSSDVDFVAGKVVAGSALVVWGVPQAFTVKSVVHARALQLVETMPGALDLSEVAYAINDDFTPILGMPIFAKDSINTQLHAERFLKILDGELPITPLDYAGRWTFDGDLFDVSANRLATDGSDLSYQTGMRFQAAQFVHSAGDYVRVAANALLNTTAHSHAVWIYPQSYGDFRAVFVRSPNFSWQNGGYGLCYLTDFYGAATVYFWTDNYMSNRIGATAPIGAWTHLVTTYDGATLKIYKNGVLAAATNRIAPPNYQNASAIPLLAQPNISASSLGDISSVPLLIGQGPTVLGGRPSNAAGWDGLIDDLIFYRRALSAKEVANIYAAYQR